MVERLSRNATIANKNDNPRLREQTARELASGNMASMVPLVRCEVNRYKQEVLRIRFERADSKRDVTLKTEALEKQLRDSRAVFHRFEEMMQYPMRRHGSVLLKSEVQTKEILTRPKPSLLMKSVEVQTTIQTL